MFDPLVGKIPWRRAWQPIPVFKPGESPWTEEPGRIHSMGGSQTQLSDYQQSIFCFLYLLMPFLYFSFIIISAAVFFCLVIPFRSFRLVILTLLVSDLLFNLLNSFCTILSTCYLHKLYHIYSQCAF